MAERFGILIMIVLGYKNMSRLGMVIHAHYSGGRNPNIMASLGHIARLCLKK
jgi:hypothetical protein